MQGSSPSCLSLLQLCEQELGATGLLLCCGVQSQNSSKSLKIGMQVEDKGPPKHKQFIEEGGIGKRTILRASKTLLLL